MVYILTDVWALSLHLFPLVLGVFSLVIKGEDSREPGEIYVTVLSFAAPLVRNICLSFVPSESIEGTNTNTKPK